VRDSEEEKRGSARNCPRISIFSFAIHLPP
jgi:hypothetical protein